MTDFSARTEIQTGVADASRKRTLGTALAELALTVALIVSIVVVLVVTGVSSSLASTRSDLIMMEETTASSSLTTIGILTVIALVMGVLTVLALRDVAPAHSKRGNRRPTRR
jgi:hypothetical protein